MRRVAALLAASAALALAVPAVAAAAPPVTYDPPVAGPVVDPFRVPAAPYAPGNRGLDFATRAGEPVGAAAGGEVTFAGQVGGALHVVVLHADGLRTSYSFLRSVGVRRGDRVEQGDAVGTAGGFLHFGVRAGTVYVDPATLFGGPPAVHLVAVELRSPASEEDERGFLRDALEAAGRLGAAGVAVTVDAVDWARHTAAGAAGSVTDAFSEHLGAQLEIWAVRLVVLAHYLQTLDVEHFARSTFDAFRAWHNADCTAASPAATPAAGRRRRRILVLVAGLGSAGGHADVLDLDAAALGYAAGDIAQFSYRGGRVPSFGELEGVASRDYGSADSQGDLRVAGRRLRELLLAIARAHRGVPIDIVAHSQGGVVARIALADGPAPAVESLVTLGSPHQGADLATALALGRTTATGTLGLRLASFATDLDPDATAIAQLAETSPLIAGLERTPLPEGVRVTSIAARGDLVVPAPRSVIPGATNVVVPIDGVSAHGALPGSPGAEREIALALAGHPPSCRPLWQVALDTTLSNAIATLEDLGGAGAGAGLLYLETRAPVRPPVTIAAGVPGR